MTIPSGATNQEKRPKELWVAREPMIPHSRPENMEVWSGIVFYWLAERIGHTRRGGKPEFKLERCRRRMSRLVVHLVRAVAITIHCKFRIVLHPKIEGRGSTLPQLT